MIVLFYFVLKVSILLYGRVKCSYRSYILQEIFLKNLTYYKKLSNFGRGNLTKDKYIFVLKT